MATALAVHQQAVCNVLNILLGVGLLSLPFAFRQAGWAGLPILGVMGIATSYTGRLAASACLSMSSFWLCMAPDGTNSHSCQIDHPHCASVRIALLQPRLDQLRSAARRREGDRRVHRDDLQAGGAGPA